MRQKKLAIFTSGHGRNSREHTTRHTPHCRRTPNKTIRSTTLPVLKQNNHHQTCATNRAVTVCALHTPNPNTPDTQLQASMQPSAQQATTPLVVLHNISSVHGTCILCCKLPWHLVGC
jgi:hypothetical protein